MKQISVYGAGETVRVYPFDGDVRISDALFSLSAGISMPCGGKGTCGACKARITGDVYPSGEQENRFLSEEEKSNGVRLCCYAHAFGDCEVFLPESGKISVMIRGRMPHYRFAPLFDGDYGVAIDIGTTTVALALFSLKTGKLIETGQAANAQGVFGADVITRIGYSDENGVDAVRKTTVGQLNVLIRELCEKTGIGAHQISGSVITGNTTMLHFLTGLDPKTIAQAPYLPKSLFGEYADAASVGLEIGGGVYLPKALSAFIGADIVCGALVCELPKPGAKSLFIDIGTNGEMLLTSEKGIVSCSAAAGPAFEGAGISCGMPALPGAIDKLRVEGDRFYFSVIGGGEPKGICGSGLIDAIAVLVKSGVIDETGRIQRTGHPFERFVSDEENGRSIQISDKGIRITQQDVRQVQLTKAAIAAGIDVLLKEGGVLDTELQEVIIAGGFGNYIDFDNAVRIGLFPESFLDKITSAGNTALSGASLMLLSKEMVERSEISFRNVRELILAQDEFFKERYFDRMAF